MMWVFEVHKEAEGGHASVHLSDEGAAYIVQIGTWKAIGLVHELHRDAHTELGRIGEYLYT